MSHRDIGGRVAEIPHDTLHLRHRNRREENQRTIIIHVGYEQIVARIERHALRTVEAVGAQPVFIRRIGDKAPGLPEHGERGEIVRLVRTSQQRKRIGVHEYAIIFRIADVNIVQDVDRDSDRLAHARRRRRRRILITSRRIEIRLSNHQVRRAARRKRMLALPSHHAIVLSVCHQHMTGRRVDRHARGRVHSDRIDEIRRILCKIDLPKHAVGDTGANPCRTQPRRHRQGDRNQRHQSNRAEPETRAHAPSFAYLRQRLPTVESSMETRPPIQSGSV